MEVGILLLVAVLLPLLLTRSPTDDEYEMMKVDWGDPIENLDDGPYDNHPAYLAADDDHVYFEASAMVITRSAIPEMAALCVMTARLRK